MMYLTNEQAKDKDLIGYLAEQVVSEPVVSVERLPGTMAYNYEINHKHIFKLPNEYTPTDDWLRQAQCAPILQSHFDFQIPQPQLKTIYTPDGKSLLSSSYPKIKGICFMNEVFANKEIPFKQNFFEQLSDAAAQIHTVSPQELPFELPTKIDYLEQCFFRNFHGDTYLPKKLFRKLMHNCFLGLGKSGLKTSLLAHTDLHPGNILLDDKNKLVAILDFDMMVRGDRFLEFRANLYDDPRDIPLFCKIYQKRSGHKIDPNDLYQLETAKKTLSWFWSLCALYKHLPLVERNKKMKQCLKQKIISQKGSDGCI